MTALLVLLAILDLEALASFLWVFFTPSESGQGVFLWLSPQRLALAAVLFLVFIALLAITVLVLRFRTGAERGLARLDDYLVKRRLLAPTIILLPLAALIIGIAALAVLTTPLDYESYRRLAPDTFPTLYAVVIQGLPVVLLIIALLSETAIFLAWRYPRVLPESRLWAWDNIGPALLLGLISILTLFHWLVLAFQLRFFVNLPAWYWIFDPVPFGVGDLWFALIALVLLAASYWLLFVRPRVAVVLVVLAVLAWFLQMGVGLMGGSGLATLRERYFTTYHQAYILKASESALSIVESIRQYETVYGSSPFTSTKPPGLMAFYIGLDHLVNGFPSTYDNAARYERLSNVVVWAFPVLAACAVFLMYVFSRRLLQDVPEFVQRLAALLYVLAPSVALFTFFADQAVYPLVFLLGVWFTVVAVRRHSLAWSLLVGAVLYAAVFFAFTMLPLYPFAGIYMLLHWRRAKPGRRLQGFLLSALAIAAGTLVLHALSLTLLNYNVLPRFERTMAINHNFDFYLRVGQQPPGVPEPLGVRLVQIAKAAWLNNLDFAVAIGFPIYVLFLVQAARRLWRFFKDRMDTGDITLLALLVSFIVLNLAGTAQGEVPRLWLFWLPMVALFAAFELEPHLQKRPHWLIGLGVVQLVTLMLTFHFQDLRM
ncbi:MAG TPA: hypothetical protein VIU39_10195 [Anaerolineales bacterium]